jgi:hypothetical protein
MATNTRRLQRCGFPRAFWPDFAALSAPRGLHLAQHFHGDRALTGNHVRVIKGVYECQPFLFLQFQRMAVGIGIALAKQHHFAAKAAHGIHFDLGRGGWHHDHRTGA